MTVIDSYLDTLFAPYPDTPRMREARSELRALMEDQQQALMDAGRTESQAVGAVIAEFGSLEEVAAELGIGAELSGGSGGAQPAADPALDREQAERYVEAMRRGRWVPAVAIPMFVLAALPLLFLIAVSGESPTGWALGVGLTTLLVLVAGGVLLLVLHGSRMEEHAEVTEGRFTLTPAVRELASSLRREHRRERALALGAAILLWILAAVPVILAGVLSAPDSTAPLYGVCGTLAMVALGLFVVLRSGWSETAAGTLLQEADEDDLAATSSSPAIRAIAALYWPVAAAIFLGWSFLTGDWGITWVVWPVAGVLYGGLWSLSAAIGSSDDAQRSPARRA
ncbi:permease prefix domain 1-containing protein [Brachybacterium sp. J144]|uniref:permease prefix domain 1-containing protein n=1 Tax=Brachybacterium sp. J144 TaxID=3116487 RepID=UPI002E799F47|nr:permease prefix domain 1-containing protein [Brachybacterium sp. J144]MEE1651811.1 permease prefix domain 1-containing protein [Brachybacterium sp. J144]